MKFSSWLALAVAVAVCGGTVASGATTSAALRESAVRYENLDALSVALTYEGMKREVNINNSADATLDARVASLMIGYDVVSWCRVFATVGAAELELPFSSSYSDWQFKWSLGVQANLWRADVSDPEFLSGSLTFKTIVEYACYRAREPEQGLDGDWIDVSVDMPFSYEIYVDRRDTLQQVPYSLALSVGPAFSIIDGDGAISATWGTDFTEKKSVGVMGAVDLYLAHNLSLGLQVHRFDKTSVGGSLLFHF